MMTTEKSPMRSFPAIEMAALVEGCMRVNTSADVGDTIDRTIQSNRGVSGYRQHQYQNDD